jgi:hypothetical protein
VDKIGGSAALGQIRSETKNGETIPPLITTTHHDGSLLSPLSYTIADDDPPLPSMPTQRSQQNLRDRRHFRNDGWTKWEAVQAVDKLEAKRAMEKLRFRMCTI